MWKKSKKLINVEGGNVSGGRIIREMRVLVQSFILTIFFAPFSE